MQNHTLDTSNLLDEILMAPSDQLINDRFQAVNSAEAACGTACGAGCGGGCGGSGR